ncbi:monodehydroascorbate reductase 2, peroxisomal-like isoform X2 [Phoenix dactylifera]|uniref:monodehydroascorbate reductase (NADH) n=1 Tax=Phoenix dactylifera TaxID=42345 RepID=A0A8B9AI85_PHODC|nr:monodehydroascorbate reductase 2, peroxisomal-like isoform X2 [Phoenix dactylifera]
MQSCGLAFLGIELVLGTKVKSADVTRKTLLTATGETISYKILIIATGARAIKLEEFEVRGSDAENVCYLRNLADASRLVDVMRSCTGGNAVVVGGGYIGMECTAALVKNQIKVTWVFPGKHCMGRLFTPKIALFYEDYYKSMGVNFIKGTVLTSFENDSGRKVTAVVLKDGRRLPADMVVVGIGIRANTGLFEGQLNMDKGGIKVNGRMQTSNSSVYAVGDVAAFPIKLFGNDVRRLEHVDSARKTARHAVAAIMAPRKTGDLDYLPFFYSRVFTLSWQFYGDNVGEVVHFGDLSSGRFGAYWVDQGRIMGAFLESGSRKEYEAIAKAVKLKATVEDMAKLEREGLEFAFQVSQRAMQESGLVLERLTPCAWHASAAAAAALSIAAFAYWYDWWRPIW